MDVYRYFIADALFMALKTRTKKTPNNSITGVLVGGGFQSCSQRLLCPCTYGSMGRKCFIMTIMTIILIIRYDKLKKSAFFIRQGPLKECLLRYIVLKTQHFCICIYRCVPVALWWLCSHG